MDFPATLARQRAFFRSGATHPQEFRSAQLHRLRRALETHEADLLTALYADLHKPAHEAYSAELGLVLGEIRNALRHLGSWMKPRRHRAPWLAWPSHGFTRPEPRGVALILGPWNYPVQLLLSPLVGALAAGCCAILKPSEYAPHTAAVIARMIRATFTEEQVTVVEGGSDVAETLLRERFDTVFFTGSSAVGRSVMTAAARHLTPVTLELGGKCPCLVCADAPLAVTARRVVWGKFMNAGQTCVAPDFVLVDRRIYPAFLQALRDAILSFYGPDPRQSPDFGRIVNRRHFDRLTAYLSAGHLAHGGQSDPGTLYVAPTLLTDVPPDAPVMQEEIFGPILPVIEFENLDDALASLRDRPTPLALYLFTRDRPTQQRVIEATRSGGVCVNDTIMQMLGQELPFGGLGESGIGSYHGRASFDAFTHHRSVLRRSLVLDPSFRYPPPKISFARMKTAMRLLLGG
ncbi:MAG: aldehyde dehydrogenase family protein [Verrucomicrobiales bacterium]|nr:aldehyde dehydrogenase family protein [Verrucomicrobiales bacterium]